MSTDPTLELAAELIRRPSVTPEDAGCQSLIAERLRAAGFTCTPLKFDEVENLWAAHGESGNGATPCVVFAGHTDVVPPGPSEHWSTDPFNPEIDGGRLYGRGATDMKSGLAAMVTAAESYVADHPEHRGRIAFLLTSDEEGPAINGTRKVVEWLQEQGQAIDQCIIGEAASLEQLGDRIMIGRRGSISATLTIEGRQGHVAYPQQADNPIHRAIPILDALSAMQWDSGNDDFPPTSLQITEVHAGTGASNVIPGTISLGFNLRFSTEQTADAIRTRVESLVAETGSSYQIEWNHSGDPFLTRRGALIDAALSAIRDVTGLDASTSTAGGTSDGRFIAPTGAEVIEVGPCNTSAHKVDEFVEIADLPRLSMIYRRILDQLLD